METNTVETPNETKGYRLDVLVDGYIKLRDKKEAIRKKYEAEVEAISRTMERIENALLKHMQSTGTESIRTPAGTIYKQRKASYSVADWDRALGFIRENELWSMLERRVSKAAVDQYREEHNDLPPGVNASEIVVVNIRRS